jgi:hypothetical protein
VPFACGNRVHSCLSCKEELCSFVSFMQGSIVSSACGNRVHSCRSCRKNRARKHRAFRLRKSCSFVPFVQDKNRARKHRAFRLRKSCSFVPFVQDKNRARSIVSSACGNRVHSCRSCKIRIVQEVSCLPLAEIVFIRAVRAR